MTRVGFYVVQEAGNARRLHIAARLADKAFRQGHRIFISTADEAQARSLSALMWSFRPASFVPHGLYGEEHAELVAIGWGQEPADHNDLLINLRLEIPPYFSRFQRVAEVVTQDPASLEALRRSWKLYKDRGYQLDKYDL